MSDVTDRIIQLSKQLDYHDNLYYNEEKPELSDAEYDALRIDYIDLIRSHPDAFRETGLKEKVGAPVSQSHLPVVPHTERLLSLGNAYDEDELRGFLKSAPTAHGYVGEVKMDGLAIRIIYEGGVLTRAVTRGDGFEGEDVTNHVKDISCLPTRLKDGYPETLEVGAEIYLSFPEFNEINKRLAHSGKDEFASPRNAASGILRRKNDADWDRQRLGACCYTLARSSDIIPDTQWECLEVMKELGLPVNVERRLLMTDKAVVAYYEDIMGRRSQLTYPIDGVVIKVNRIAEQKTLGATGRIPKWAIAWKPPALIYKTILTDIITQVGRTGVVTPVAVLAPVMIDGIKVTRATLHNEDYIAQRDIRIGDVVGVQRAGDVIPKVVGPLLDKMDGQERGKPYVFNKTCPSCQSALVRLDGEAAWKCLNISECPTQRLECLTTICSRDALNIIGLSRQTLCVLLTKGIITTAPSIFRLKDHRDELLKIDGFQKKSVDNLLASIETARHVSLGKFLYALQIDHVGRSVSRDIAKAFHSKEAIFDAFGEVENSNSMGYKRLASIPGIGRTILQSIAGYMRIQDNVIAMHDLADMMDVGEEMDDASEKLFDGKKVCFTGTFTKKKRKDWEALALSLGAKVVNKVTAGTDWLVVGDGGKPGTKLDDAKKYNVDTLNEGAFEALVK